MKEYKPRKKVEVTCRAREFYPHVKWRSAKCKTTFMATSADVLFCAGCRDGVQQRRKQFRDFGIEHPDNPMNRIGPLFANCAYPKCEKVFISGYEDCCCRKHYNLDLKRKLNARYVRIKGKGDIPKKPKYKVYTPKMLQWLLAEQMPPIIQNILNGMYR